MTAVLLALPLIAAAPVPNDFRKESWNLEGCWKLTKYQVYGQEFEQVTLEWTIEGDSLLESQAGKPIHPQASRIKTSTRTSPQTIDIQRDGKTRLGIWKIVEDKLMICLGSETKRPTKFECNPDQTHYTFTRQRSK